MSFHVVFAPRAAKDLARSPHCDQARIIARISDLADTPWPRGCRKLASQEEMGEDVFCIRVGSYRVLYIIQARILIVLILRIGDRKDIYRGI